MEGRTDYPASASQEVDHKTCEVERGIGQTLTYLFQLSQEAVGT